MTRTVLLVDDDPNIILSLEFLIEQAGHETRVASDGEAAMKAIAEYKPDLVLLDVMLPKRDGFDVCKSIRANPAWKDIRIVMLTAKGHDSERKKGLALGADAYITKPFSTREAMKLINGVLGDKESEESQETGA